ncbi:hypothetical protein B194_2373 [Serratia plymuthica A30]|nr:hypothetical protein B194_2373 [Serratia plymuthica A30]
MKIVNIDIDHKNTIQQNISLIKFRIAFNQNKNSPKQIKAKVNTE